MRSKSRCRKRPRPMDLRSQHSPHLLDVRLPSFRLKPTSNAIPPNNVALARRPTAQAPARWSAGRMIDRARSTTSSIRL